MIRSTYEDILHRAAMREWANGAKPPDALVHRAFEELGLYGTGAVLTAVKLAMEESTFVIPEGKKHETYLEWIRGLECCAPGGCSTFDRVDPHHRTGGGMGSKVSDLETLPLCRTHHREFHDLRGPFKGWVKAELRKWQIQKCVMYIGLYSMIRLGHNVTTDDIF